jgi:hypothetical protein
MSERIEQPDLAEKVRENHEKQDGAIGAAPPVLDYDLARRKLDKFLDEQPLHLEMLDRETVESAAANSPALRGFATIEQRCVNYLRHHASAYDRLIQALNSPGDLFPTQMERHVLHVERRRAVARIKKRVLDEIAEKYPWLKQECLRQKQRDGVEDDASQFVLRFGPFKGRALREIDTDYLLRLLGQSAVRKAFRTRIERHLAERAAGAC